MVALPGFKFLFLGIRQLTRPIVKQIVARATTKRGATYSMCIGLGRVSLGLTGVIGEWSRKEEMKRLEGEKKAAEAERERVAKTAAQDAKEVLTADAKMSPAALEAIAAGMKDPAPSSSSGAAAAATPDAGAPTTKATDGTTPTTTTTTSATAAATAAAAQQQPEKQHVVSFIAPRSRSLLEPITFGPKPEGGPAYDASVFIDPQRTSGEAMRVFVRHPYASAWFVFRTAFLAPFPEKRLVDAGAEFLVELLAYTILATLLFIELRQASRAAAAKERRVNERLDAIEEKINELVRTGHGASQGGVQQLPPVPQLHIQGRLDTLGYLAKSTVRLADHYIVSPLMGTTTATATTTRGLKRQGEEGEQQQQQQPSASATVAAPTYDKKSVIPKAPPVDPAVKISKHDETAAMKAELANILGTDQKTN